MQLDKSMLRLVSVMLPESYKLQMVAKAFRLLTAENYRQRVRVRHLTYSRRAIMTIIRNRNAIDGPFLEFVYGWNINHPYMRLYRMNYVVIKIWIR